MCHFVHIYICIQSLFLYLAILYLAEAVITIPSPRNHILDLFIWQLALSGNGQSDKFKFFTTITSLIPFLFVKGCFFS